MIVSWLAAELMPAYISPFDSLLLWGFLGYDRKHKQCSSNAACFALIDQKPRCNYRGWTCYTPNGNIDPRHHI